MLTEDMYTCWLSEIPVSTDISIANEFTVLFELLTLVFISKSQLKYDSQKMEELVDCDWFFVM